MANNPMTPTNTGVERVECKHCGLLKSRVEATGYLCFTSPIGSTRSERFHDFGEEMKQPHQESWEIEFEKIAVYTNEYSYVHKIPKFEEIKSFISQEKEKSYEEGYQKATEVAEGSCNQAYEKGKAEAEKERYHSDCIGCKGGHSSFWETVTKSPQWKLWQEEQRKRFATEIKYGVWDIDECQECGWISQEHFQDFIKFILDLTHENRGSGGTGYTDKQGRENQSVMKDFGKIGF
jgi:hypothetical protein